MSRATHPQTPRLVKVPDVKPPGGLCWKQKLDRPGAMTRCVFKANHKSRHSWQKEPNDRG